MDYTKMKGCHPGGDPVGLKGPDGMNTLSSYQAGRDDMVTLIKAEIERLKDENRKIKCQANERYCSGYDDAFYDLVHFLDTLESEKPVPNDLEEAARHSEILTYPMPEDGDIEKVFKVQEARVFHEIGFIAGAKWQKEQMMKEAVKWLVDDDYDELTDKGRFILGSVGIGYNGYYIPYSDLLKLPKEDLKNR